MAISTASNWLWNLLRGFFAQFITGNIDFANSCVFADCLFVAMLLVYFFVLEGGQRKDVRGYESNENTPLEKQ